MHKELYDDSDLSTAEKRTLAARLLRARSALARRAPACLHRLFEAHAALDPEAVALTCDDLQLSYDDLNARSNRLARRLREFHPCRRDAIRLLGMQLEHEA